MFEIIRADKKLLLLLFICTVIIFFFSSKFSPLYNFNYWGDINIYYTIGKSIWHGKVIYKDVFDHKGPLIFFIYSLGYPFSKIGFGGMFIVQVCFQFITILFTYRSLNLFVKQKYISIIASPFIFFFLLNFTLDGGSAEEFIFTFQVVSLYYFLRFFKENDYIHNPRYMIIHGIMLACAFYIKLNLVLFWFFPLACIFLIMFIKKDFRCLLKNILGLLLGILSVSFLLLFYFSYHNALSDFFSGYITFNRLYVSQTIFNLRQILSELLFKIKRDYIVFTVLVLGSAYFLMSSLLDNKWGRLSLILSLGVMILMTVPNSIHLHYYLIPLFSFCVLGIVSITVILEKCLSSFKINTILFAFLFSASMIFISIKKDFFNFSFSALYNRDFPVTNIEYFRDIIGVDNDATLLCLGTAMPLFTETGIVPSVKYFFSPNISNKLFPELRESHAFNITNRVTEYVVIDAGRDNTDYYQELLSEHYNLVGDNEDFTRIRSLLYKRK